METGSLMLLFMPVPGQEVSGSFGLNILPQHAFCSMKVVREHLV